MVHAYEGFQQSVSHLNDIGMRINGITNEKFGFVSEARNWTSGDPKVVWELSCSHSKSGGNCCGVAGVLGVRYQEVLSMAEPPSSLAPQR